MPSPILAPETQAAVRLALAASWSARTSVCYNPSIAPLSYGQCAPTAVVIHEHFGGEILRTELVRHDGHLVRHFYNRIDGQRLDFTEDQLAIPDYWAKVEYTDIPSSPSEATTEMMPGQLDEMRRAFRSALNVANAV